MEDWFYCRFYWVFLTIFWLSFVGDKKCAYWRFYKRIIETMVIDSWSFYVWIWFPWDSEMIRLDGTKKSGDKVAWNSLEFGLPSSRCFARMLQPLRLGDFCNNRCPLASQYPPLNVIQINRSRSPSLTTSHHCAVFCRPHTRIGNNNLTSVMTL